MISLYSITTVRSGRIIYSFLNGQKVFHEWVYPVTNLLRLFTASNEYMRQMAGSDFIALNLTVFA